jgi:hypothetical protein
MQLIGSRISSATSDDPVLAHAVQPSYVVLFDFRDVILRRSALGREALALFEAYSESFFDLLRHDPSLETRWLTLLSKATIFAQDILRAYTLRGLVTAGTLRVDRAICEEIRGFLHEMASQSQDGRFQEVLSRSTAIVELLADQTAAEVLGLLEVEEGVNE